jgi:inhibitor of cysteine peptidase
MFFIKKEIKDDNELKQFATKKLNAIEENFTYPEKLSPKQIILNLSAVKATRFNYQRIIRYSSAFAICFIFVVGISLSLSTIKKIDPLAQINQNNSYSLHALTESLIGTSSIITQASSKKPTSKPSNTSSSPSSSTVTKAKTYDEIINAFKVIYKNNANQGNRGVMLEKNAQAMSPNAPVTNGQEKSTTTQAAGTLVSGTSDYSTTNLQVDGVDEGDIVKNDGSYLYTLLNNKISIADVHDPKNMTIVSTLTFDNSNAVDMYIYKSKLIVVMNLYQNVGIYTTNQKSAPVYNYNNQTKVLVYDISDRSNPKISRTFIQEGNFDSSRMIGNYIYLATSYYANIKDTNNITAEQIVPKTGDGTNQTMLPASDVFIPCEPQSATYAVVSGVNVEDSAAPASTVACVGSAGNVFASLDNLYLSSQRAYYPVAIGAPIANGGTVTNGIKSGAIASTYQQTTDIIRFNLSSGKVAYTGVCNVSGNIQNQFSMDEYNGYFRIATTTYSPNMNNNLYIYDSNLKLVGSIENMAQGENIHSVRFMNNRAYIVTFRTVDPLFVIDLTNPKAPKVMGELKIPGFSDYLQPYSENLIIGFGKDAVESGNTAYYQGLKLSLFDVSDPLNPKETFSYHIGDRGSTSPVLTDHRSLLFNKDKNIIAFPVTLTKLTTEADKDNINAYGSFDYDGYYVMGLDPAKGFSLKGSVTHLESGNQNDLYNLGLQMQRGAYIGNVLYTISNAKIVASSLDSFNKLGEVSLKYNNNNGTTVSSAGGSVGGGIVISPPAQTK